MTEEMKVLQTGRFRLCGVAKYCVLCYGCERMKGYLFLLVFLMQAAFRFGCQNTKSLAV